MESYDPFALWSALINLTMLQKLAGEDAPLMVHWTKLVRALEPEMCQLIDADIGNLWAHEPTYIFKVVVPATQLREREVINKDTLGVYENARNSFIFLSVHPSLWGDMKKLSKSELDAKVQARIEA